VIRTVAFESFRSLRDLTLSLDRLTVITGPNGSGKSNVYRALRLLTDAAGGELGRSLAREGGLPSALWAGPERVNDFRVGEKRRRGPAQGTRRTRPVRLSLGFGDENVSYQLRLGLPIPAMSMFGQDPEVKAETMLAGTSARSSRLLERRGLSAMVRDAEGHAVTFGAQLDTSESVLAQLSEPHRYPVLSMMRERLRRWRFYHHLRTDADSPLRQAQIGTRTPVLSHDGRDLAAALRTIEEIGHVEALHRGIADALDGALLQIEATDARFSLALRSPGMLRALGAAELSDGTLRYLALLAALLSPRPPELLVLNEPEASLHPRVLAPLGAQIVAASRATQLVVVTHAAALVDAIAAAHGEREGLARIELCKEDGETTVAGRRPLDEPPWHWVD
jgi:predicted ATPase